MKHSFPKRLTAFALAIFTVLSVLVAVPILTVGAAGTQTYVKVTEAPTDWSGTYLIVYEDGQLIMDGSLATFDAVGNTHSVTIESNTISGDFAAYAFEIVASGTGYSIQGASGKYIGQSSNANGLKTLDSAEVQTLSLNDDGSVNIISSGGAYLRYNSASNQTRFRYYKSSSYTNQKAIALYKLASAAHEHAYAWDGNIGTDGSHSLACANTDGKCEVLTTIADCTWEDGFCSVCGATAPECAHPTKTEVPEVPATCTEGGYTAGVQCTVCNQYISGHEEIGPKGHTEVADAAKDPTCTETGLTEGKHCSVCNEVLVKQDVIPATGHNFDATGVCQNADCGLVAVSYTLVTDIANLNIGDQIVIANFAEDKEGKFYALSTTQNTNNRGQIEVTVNNSTLFGIEGVQVLTVEAGAIDGTFALNTGSGYLYAAGGTDKNNYLRTSATKTDDGAWTISVAENGVATVKAPDTILRNQLFYNSGNDIFSCYASGQEDIAIYKLVVPAPEIRSFSLSLNKGITVKVSYYIPSEWLAENADAKLVFSNGKELAATAGLATYSVDLTPGQIDDALTLTLKVGETEVATHDVSVAQYQTMFESAGPAGMGLSETRYAALDNLLKSINTLAAAADNDLTGELTEDFSEVTETPGFGDEVGLFGSISAVVGEKASVKLNVNVDNMQDAYAISVTLGNKTLVDNQPLADYVTADEQIVLNGLYPAHFNDVIEVSVSISADSGAKAAIVQFTFNSYLKALYDTCEAGSNAQKLVAAIYQYGLAVEAYRSV